MPGRESLPAAVARAARLLDALRLPAALIGGTAVAARIYVRLTKDVDALVSCPLSDVEPILARAREHGYDFNETDAADFREVGMIRLWGPPGRKAGVAFDILLADDAFTRNVIARATTFDVFGTAVPVAQPEDLMLLKLQADRAIDMDDSIAIKDALGAKLDVAYLRAEADKLGAAVKRRLNLLLPL